MSPITSLLPQLRNQLEELESYKLPDQFHPPSSSPSSSPTSTIDPELFQRYLKAKDIYLRKRMNQLFIEHLSTIQFNHDDNDTNSNNNNSAVQITLPPKPTKEEIQELNENKENASQELVAQIQSMHDGYESIHEKYKLLGDKKDDIRHLIQTLEQKQQQTEIMEDEESTSSVQCIMMHEQGDDDDNDLDINAILDQSACTTIQESELMEEEEKLRALRERKSKLLMRLHKLQTEKELMKSKVIKDQRLVKDLIAARHGDGGSNATANTTVAMNANDEDDGENFDTTTATAALNLENLPSMEEIQMKTNKLQEQSHQYKDMAEYYDSIRCAMEVIGGMKILSITSLQQQDEGETQEFMATSPVSSPSTSPTKASSHASKKKKVSPSCKNRHYRHHQSSSSSASSSTFRYDDNSDSIILKVQLLDHHIINLTLTTSSTTSISSSLSSISSPNQQQSSQLNYRVQSAKLETSTIITDSIHDINKIINGKSYNVSMEIPPLDDLVSLSQNLKPLDSTRFILRETMARIRSISQRVDMLAQLKDKYLTKVTNPMKNKVKFGYGGEYQEVICSLPCQITVVLRLTCDCPLLDGSVYIHQIVGVSGWDKKCLERMQKKINSKRWRNPIDVMDALDEEIERLLLEEGVCLPKTPTLPMKRK